MAKGKKYSEAFIKKHLSGFKNSGLIPAVYCKQENIPTSTFHYWYKKYKNSSHIDDFLEIDISISQKQTVSPLEIKHGEFSISIPDLFSSKQLVSVLTCMKEALGDSTSSH